MSKKDEKQETINGAKSWREILEESEETEIPEENRLTVIIGDWAITFLDNGNPYSFDSKRKRKQADGEYKEETQKVFGVNFLVNAKHMNSGGTWNNVTWGVTAKTILRRLAQATNDLIGTVIRFKATGEGLQRRYQIDSVKVPEVKHR